VDVNAAVRITAPAKAAPRASASRLQAGAQQIRANPLWQAIAIPEQARHVIRLMARAMADVGASWVEA